MATRSEFEVELQGGLGNQLFILAAGLTAAERFGSNLVLDARSLSRVGEREIAIEPVLSELNRSVRVLKGSRSFGARAIRLARIKTGSSKYFLERLHGYDSRFENLTQNQTLYGYFQSPHYFSTSTSKSLATALEALRLQSSPSSTGRVHLHIRRGDYLSASASKVHGLAGLGFFQRAVKRIRETEPEAQFKVFTDSPEQIPTELLADWDALIEENQAQATPLESLLELASGSGIVMSNSSFSWWAAWLISQRDAKAQIIAPRPWFANGDSASTLLLPDWVTLGNE